MFPLYDSTPRNTFPFVNYAIIALNIFAFYLQLTTPNFEAFIMQYAFIPANFSFFDINSYLNVFTSIFLHGGFLHIISNLWFLRIFGDNVEDRLGHVHYLLFYLLAGFFATMAQYVADTSSLVPMIGASGAISGVAGAYFVLYRDSKVKTLLPFFGFFTVINLSVGFFLGYWFLIQVISGVGSLAVVNNSGGVAFLAHVGGFIFGYLYAKTLKPEVAVETGEIVS